jgi:uncharacterized membrane protein YfhO
MTGAVRPGDVVSVQVNADRGWRARQDGREIDITQDKLGFIVLHPAPSAATRIELHYWGTVEQRVMAVLCGMTWILALTALWRARRA